MRVTSTRSIRRSAGNFSRPALALLLLSRRNHHLEGVQRARSHRSEQGLTLIECLVAIIIISLTVVAITPPIMLATASRIQSRKVEKANQIAQGEIDRVRLLVERGSYTLNDLPGATATNTISAAGAASSPTSGPLASPSACPTTYPSTTIVASSTLIRVDVDGNCIPEYVMQVFRTPGYNPDNDVVTKPPFSFEMGVRVYAFYPDQTFLPLDTTKASIRMGTGPLDVASGKRRPMAVLYSKMARNDSSRSLGQMCLQNGGTTTNCTY